MVTKLLVSDSDTYEDRGQVVTLAFGTGNSDMATTTVTGCPWVTTSTRFVTSVVGTSTRSVEEALIEMLHVGINNIVAGVGFDVIAHAPSGAQGDFTVHVVGV